MILKFSFTIYTARIHKRNWLDYAIVGFRFVALENVTQMILRFTVEESAAYCLLRRARNVPEFQVSWIANSDLTR